ncbi:MAG: hypothetical protein ABJF10_19740 [Chthoniobacter sp.]
MLSRSLLAVALFLPIQIVVGQTVAPGGATAGSDAAKRLEWLKSRGGAEAAPSPTPTPAPVIKKRFAEIRAPALRPLDVRPEETPAPNPTPVQKAVVDTQSATPAPRRTADAHAASPTPTPKKTRLADRATAETPPPAAPRAPETPAATPRPKIARASPSPTASPRPIAQRAPATHAATSPTPSPRPIAQRASPTPAATPSPRPIAQRATPTPAPLKIQPAATPSIRITSTTYNNNVASRYPWKTNIVTTVFWIGEPVGGHNFTPNFASSWDSNWTRAYGGYDNPNPEARRNFIPTKFTPRQNPFYVALPYNDVTRGTTKPEARVVIPWFREAFRKEGQSVCRDRWIAIRNRVGRVVYAQWSDCGPFRTDHWQYVFGMEKPKPNLNQGAGLDVSPAVRDYLGLQSTDVTDWKFVEAKDVPGGPWSLYGDNNTCPQKSARFTKSGGQPPEVAVTRIRPY